MRDARVGEHALHVVLDHRHHVADDDRRGREHPEHIGEPACERAEGLRHASRSSATNAAAFTVTDMKAVTEAGAPS